MRERASVGEGMPGTFCLLSGVLLLQKEDLHGYLRPLSLDEALPSADLVGPERRLEQVDPQEQVAERETVRQALAQLSAEQRRVIALRYGADLTEADIAQVLRWPIGTVKSRLNRAREHLRELLNDEGDELL